MTAARTPQLLSPSLIDSLPAAVGRPQYDRAALKPGMAHIGIGAFHRCHQAEYTDDLLGRSLDRWGVVGINIRKPSIAETLGRQSGLYTRLSRQDGSVEARVIGSIVSTVDSQESAAPALSVLADAAIDVITLTVTEKGYCHQPSTGTLDTNLPDIVHDLGTPEAPKSLPGLVMRALELRRLSHGRPLTVISCDNIPGNGAILSGAVRALADRRGGGLAKWIETNAAFPSTMVDRIAPATGRADFDYVENQFGYIDRAVAVGEPFRQWVIEERFAGRVPRWDLVGATFVTDVTAFEHLKMRVLNAAQSTLAYLGLFTGYEHTFEAVADPLLADFVRRMLIEESLPTLEPVPGIRPEDYVEQSLGRIANTAIRHRNHQIATDGSQKIVQRLLNPIRDRQRVGEASPLLSVAVAAWMAYLVSAAGRFGSRWQADDPFGERVASIADRVGRDAESLVAEILTIDAIFEPRLAQSEPFRASTAAALQGLLSDDPRAFLQNLPLREAHQLKLTGQTG